jgi:hypothetical protein
MPTIPPSETRKLTLRDLAAVAPFAGEASGAPADRPITTPPPAEGDDAHQSLYSFDASSGTFSVLELDLEGFNEDSDVFSLFD